MKTRFLAGILAGAGLMALSSPAAAQFGGGPCDRANLQMLADKYVQAQEEGLPLRIPMGNWVVYNENGALSTMSQGILSTPLKITWHRALLDEKQCKVYLEMIADQGDHPHVIAVQFNGFGGNGSNFNVIDTDKGDWLFDAAYTHKYAQIEDWSEIPPDKRETPDQLKAAADAYLDYFKDKSVQVPWGTPCDRLEGSAYIGKGTPQDSCNVGVPNNIAMADRQYVIDPIDRRGRRDAQDGPERAARQPCVPDRERQDPLHPHRDQLRQGRQLRPRQLRGNAQEKPGHASGSSGPKPDSARIAPARRTTRRAGNSHGRRACQDSGMPISPPTPRPARLRRALRLRPSAAPAQDTSFDAYMQLRRGQSARRRASARPRSTRCSRGLQPSQRVIALDRDNVSSPVRSGFPALAPYLSSHNTPSRIAGGPRRSTSSSARSRAQVEQRYGVPAPILIAIWGHETSYGAVKGNFDLAEALATLAWQGRRRALFETELIDLMRMVQQGVPRSRLVGSWAGAFGNPQFLPSIYLRLAVDGDGDGVRNIWDSRTDTLYSIANYFRDAGWRPGQPWGVRAQVPPNLNRQALVSPMNPPELRAGLRPPQQMEDRARMARARRRPARRRSAKASWPRCSSPTGPALPPIS